MNGILIKVGVILVLLAVNGVFAMTEIAVVSARKRRLRCLLMPLGWSSWSTRMGQYVERIF